MKIKSSFKTLAFLYDFAIDGGPVGTINLGVFVPAGARMKCTIFPDTINPLVSNTSTNISIGTIDNIGGLVSTSSYAHYNNQSLVDYNTFFLDVDTSASQIIMTIAIDDLISGTFRGAIELFEFD